MTSGEQRIFWKGLAAGTIVGLAIGLMIAFVIAVRPTIGTTAAFATGLAVSALILFFGIRGSRTNAGA